MRRDNPFIRTRCRCRLKAARLPLINRGGEGGGRTWGGEGGLTPSPSLGLFAWVSCLSPSRTAERKMLKQLAGNNGRRFSLSGRDGLGGIPIKSNVAHFKTVLVTLLFHPKSSFGAFCSFFFFSRPYDIFHPEIHLLCTRPDNDLP